MRSLIIFLSFLLTIPAFSQEINYSADSIPEKLKAGAHTVKRFEQISFEVKDLDQATYNVHKVVTVLDEFGKDVLSFGEYTNKSTAIDDIDIRLFDARGKLIGRYRKKDLKKQASMEGLVDDNFYHYIQLPAPSYPVTVEYKYTLSYSGTMYYPAYRMAGIDESVVYSSYTATVPKELGLRYKQQRLKLKPSVTENGKFISYKWEIKDVLALKEEKGSVAWRYYYPAIILAPNKFRQYNTYGELTSWKAFGQWGYELTNGLEVLPDERKVFFTEMVKKAGSEREKVAIVYDYLQKNFRYVSIQLGIGGYKAFPAKFTDDKKYGDCKGLSFYMHSVLKTLGIRSYMALINAMYDQEPADPAFPCNSFNHAILCVPQPTDSIWLECTSKTKEFAVLGSSTENRNALLLTEKGGFLVSTPTSSSSANRFTAFTKIDLKDDASGTSNTWLTNKGDFMDDMFYVINAKKDDQKSYLIYNMGFKHPDEFSVTCKSKVQGQDTEINLEFEKIPQFSAGSKMFLNPRIYSLWSKVLPLSDNRTQDYYFECPFEKTDTTVYHIPVDYIADAFPAPRENKCEYASYVTRYWYDKEKSEVYSVAKLVLDRNRIPADKYAEIKKFFDGVIADSGQKIVIKKN